MNQHPRNKVYIASEIGHFRKGLTPAFMQVLSHDVKVYYF